MGRLEIGGPQARDLAISDDLSGYDYCERTINPMRADD
jgi:hypothetical protein